MNNHQDIPPRDAILDIRGVIEEHVGTLRSFRTGRQKVAWVILFFGAPAVAAVVLYVLDLDVSPVSAVVVTALAILAGLLFNLLLLIFDAAGRTRDMSSRRDDLRLRLLRDTHANVAFAILMSILTAVVGVLAGLAHGTAQRIITAVVFYLLGVFVLTLLMILKRVRVLIDDELRRSRQNRAAS